MPNSICTCILPHVLWKSLERVCTWTHRCMYVCVYIIYIITCLTVYVHAFCHTCFENLLKGPAHGHMHILHAYTTCIYFSQNGFADLNILSTSFAYPMPASTSYFQEISESATPTIPPHPKTNIFSNRRKCTKIWYFKADTMNIMKLINICRDLFTSYSATNGEEFQMVGHSLQLNISNNFYKTGIYLTISHQQAIPSPMVVQNWELKLRRELFLITPTMMVL